MIKTKENTNLDDPYYIVYKDSIILNQENPYVWRTEYGSFRRSDNKELGRQVMYSRRGGDMPTGISHPSHFSCNQLENFDSNLTKAVFSAGV